MSRSYKGGIVPRSQQSQSASVAAAQQIAAQQLALTGGFGVGGTAMGINNAARVQPRTASSLKGGRAMSAGRLVPRGSAAPADATIDLSSFTGRLGATAGSPLAHTVPAVPGLAPSTDDTTSAAALENEYIVNLQQQVYFLELELNLLKKAGGGGGALNPAGLRGSGAPGADANGVGISDATVPDAPLDDVIVSLREKYVKMEAEYKKEMEEMRSENADLRSRARMRELEINNLKQLHQNVVTESNNWKASAQEHQSTLLDHQLANEQMILKLTQRLQKREKKLEKVMEELVHLRAEHKVTLENYAAEREQYTQKWNEREKKMDELNESYLREKETNLEWAERFRQSNEAKLLSQVQELEQNRLAQDSAVKKAELSAAQAEKNRRAAQEALEQIMNENEGLRAAVQSMETERKEAERKEERDRNSRSFWSAEVASLQQQVAQLTDKLDKINSKYTDSKGVKKQLKDELIKSRVYLDELQTRLSEEQESHNSTRSREEDLSETTRELKRDLTLKTEELSELVARYKELRAEADAAAKDRDHFHVQLTELQSKVDIAESLQNLKLHEFVSMAHSNLKVAGAIEALMGKMKKGEAEVKASKREARHNRRENDLYGTGSPRDSITTSSLTPRSGSSSSLIDSRPTTQDSAYTNTSDSRPATASAADVSGSFDGL